MLGGCSVCVWGGKVLLLLTWTNCHTTVCAVLCCAAVQAHHVCGVWHVLQRLPGLPPDCGGDV